jgi:uncharacterized sulfatase
MLRFYLPTLFIVLAVLQNAANPVVAEQPNFLLIMSDDSTWSDFGFTGSPNAKTPNLDRLCEQGLEMTAMYSPAACCSPTRHALYSGLFPIRSGAYPNHTMLKSGTKTLGQYLSVLGYRTALQGKSHVAPSSAFPWEVLGKGRDRQDAVDDFSLTREFFKRNSDQPWMLAYMSTDPHGPNDRGDAGDYPPESIEVPSVFPDTPEIRRHLSKYYAEIGKLDWAVGNLMKLLQETNQVENTVVVFLSEQGAGVALGGKHTLYDSGIKAATIIRWPAKIKADTKSDALASYVDIVPTFIELAGGDPTKIDSGCPDADGNRSLDGKSIVGVILGECQTHRDVTFAQETVVGINGYLEPYPIRAATDGRFKYIRNLSPQNTFEINGTQGNSIVDSWWKLAENDPAIAKKMHHLKHRPAEEFYDTVADPDELTNLAGAPKFESIQKKLSEELDRWMHQQMDKGLETEKQALMRQPRNLKKRKPGES